jgi:hypothetical protein
MGEGGLPRWVKPRLCALVDEPPQGPEWLHEIKYDAIACTPVSTAAKPSCWRAPAWTGTHKYAPIAAALSLLPL